MVGKARVPAADEVFRKDNVLQRMVDGHPINRLDDLLPWNWTPTPVNP
jgi:hypothetical protein